MLRGNNYGARICWILAGLLTLTFSAAAFAEEFVPYPGKRKADLVSIDAPNLINVTFDTDATGFTRTLHIRLPGIVIAEDTPHSDECEREASKRALGFTQKFMTEVKEIYVQDILMENSADEEATSPILTDKGSLSEVLVEEGLARSDSIDPSTPWCK